MNALNPCYNSALTQWRLSRAIVFDKETNGIALQKGMDVSFKFEEGAKGPLAKDLRLEDPARVARVTAKVHYGKVEVSTTIQCDTTSPD